MERNEIYPTGSLRDLLVKENIKHAQRLNELWPYFGKKGHKKESQEYMMLKKAISQNEYTIMKINESYDQDKTQK